VIRDFCIHPRLDGLSKTAEMLVGENTSEKWIGTFECCGQKLSKEVLIKKAMQNSNRPGFTRDR
jgi:hypothetical protein